MPSPGMTAMRAFRPPVRIGMPGKFRLLDGCREPSREILLIEQGAILPLKRQARQLIELQFSNADSENRGARRFRGRGVWAVLA
jgi:hypothetical protein